MLMIKEILSILSKDKEHIKETLTKLLQLKNVQDQKLQIRNCRNKISELDDTIIETIQNETHTKKI